MEICLNKFLIVILVIFLYTLTVLLEMAANLY
jgi:hypothetical protein